jgi:16S rRNA (cytosine1402-N4)-methyltransferase
MPDDAPPHRRRPRYKGTHPRRFEEKYKELDPRRFTDEKLKVEARGQTPAGSHRSIMVEEILDRLAPGPGESALDATLGYGGHAREIMVRLQPGGHLVGLDMDPIELPRTEARLRGEGFGPEIFSARRINFAGLPALISQTGQFDCILADLGVSSMQIDDPLRGFTYKADGPLDLRFNPRRGKPASELLASLSELDLTEVLETNSDEPFARQIAHTLCSVDEPISRTQHLADLIRGALKASGFDRTAPQTRSSLQRCFQALRIAVNDEEGVLDQFLSYIPAALKPGGRVAILSFHSGEDRRVKKAFQAGLRSGIFSDIAAKPERPSYQEQRENPRSSSAKLRWAVKPR